MKDLVEIAPRAADAGPAPLSATKERLLIL